MDSHRRRARVVARAVRQCAPMKHAIALGLVSLVLTVTVAGCAAEEADEETETIESAQKRRARAPKFDVKPLGSRERDMIDRHRAAGWWFEKGGMARTKGMTLMGAPAAGNLWIFAVDDGR